jgi:hypothetical protein
MGQEWLVKSHLPARLGEICFCLSFTRSPFRPTGIQRLGGADSVRRAREAQRFLAAPIEVTRDVPRPRRRSQKQLSAFKYGSSRGSGNYSNTLQLTLAFNLKRQLEKPVRLVNDV